MKKANKKINFHLEFSHEKLAQIISKTNTLCEKMSNEDYENTPDSEKTQNEEVIKTYSNYIKKYLEHITKSDSQELIATLKFLFTLNKFAWKKIGDEFTDALWNLYDDEGFHIGESTGHFNFYAYFLNLFFLNSPNLTLLMKKEAIKFNTAEKTVITEINSELFEELKFENIPTQKNFLIDMFIIQILSCADIKMFYTNLSAFIVATESNVMKLFKIISLFALSLWQIEKKENFLGSLLYIVGGVLRDHGKSYLKTKGILEQNLSYHLCPKDVNI